MNNYLTFALKTNQGYGLIQHYGLAYPYNWPFYIIYRQQIKELNPADIKIAMNGEYYYQRLMSIELKINELWESGKYLKNKEYSLSEIENIHSHDNDICYITYLGEYPLPVGASMPKISRELVVNYYSGTHFWRIINETTRISVCNNKGKSLKYKNMTSEIALYPDFFGIYIVELLERFNIDFRIEDYNDNCVPEILESKYADYPDMRPSKIDYEETKKLLPTENWKKNAEGNNDKVEYLSFCDRIEAILKALIDYLDGGGKSIKPQLINLINSLNKIQEQTQLIGSMEAEDLYTYISQILKSIRKSTLINTLEELREW